MIKCKLGELLDVKRGASLSGQYYATKGNFIRLTLGNFNYPNGGFKENTSKEDIFFVGNVKKEFILKEGDIITPLTEQVAGLLGETARIPESNKYIQSGDVGLIIPDETKLNKEFAYYLVSSPVVKKQLGAAAQQTKIRHTSPDKIKACDVWIPDLKYQEKAGRILDNINNKISNNNKIILELESMAKTIYDYWFLQYEFPNTEGKPYKAANGKFVYNEILKREIPEGWKVSSLIDCVDSSKNAIVDGPFGTQMKIEEYVAEGVPIYEMEQLNGAFIVAEPKHFITEEKYEEVKRSSVKNGDIIVSKTGTLGLTGIVKSNYAHGIIVSRLAKITPNPDIIGKYALLIYLEKLEENGYWLKVCGGSTMPILNNKIIGEVKITIPNSDIYQRFEQIVTPMYKRVYEAQMENQELESMRNFLQPLLINGQVNFNR